MPAVGHAIMVERVNMVAHCIAKAAATPISFHLVSGVQGMSLLMSAHASMSTVNAKFASAPVALCYARSVCWVTSR